MTDTEWAAVLVDKIMFKERCSRDKLHESLIKVFKDSFLKQIWVSQMTFVGNIHKLRDESFQFSLFIK